MDLARIARGSYRNADVGFADSEIVLSEEFIVGVDDGGQAADVEVGLVAQFRRVFIVSDHHFQFLQESGPDDLVELLSLDQTLHFARVVGGFHPERHRHRVLFRGVAVGYFHQDPVGVSQRHLLAASLKQVPNRGSRPQSYGTRQISETEESEYYL